MTTTHTPGPWHVDDDLARGNRVVSDRENGIVAIVQGSEEPERWDVPNEERDANARLIAATPELNEQLQFCCEQLAECMEQNHGRIWDNANTVLANARALLASLEPAR